MNARTYLKSVLLEGIILIASALCLGYCLASGFKASSDVATTLLTVGVIDVVLVVALYATAFRSKNLLPGIVVIAVLTVVALVVGVVSSGGAAFDDEPGNLLVLGLVAYLAALAAFLLTRTRIGCLIYVVFGCLAIAFLEFMFEEYHYVPALAFTLLGIVLVIVRNYTVGLKGTQTKKTSFVSVGLVAFVAAIMAGLVGCVVFFAVVAPLDPGALEPKLTIKEMALEELPRRGTSAELAVTNPDMTSAVTDESTVSADEGDDRERDESLDDSNGYLYSDATAAFGSAVGYTMDAVQEGFQTITMNVPWYGWILIVIVVLLILAAPWVIKLQLRKRFYEKASAQPIRSYVDTVYQRVLRDFRRMGVQYSDTLTPYEFALSCEREVADFSANASGTNFLMLTCVMVKAQFGAEPLRVEEISAVDDFYRAFYKNCRAHLGTPKYLLKFFRL